jgi:hypothetical protein
MCACVCVCVCVRACVDHSFREHTEKGLRIPKRPSEVRAAPRAAAPVALRANVDVDEDQIEGSETDGRAYDEPDGKILDAARYIEREFVEEFWDNTNRHEAGVGFLGSCFGVTRVRKLDVNTKERLAELDANTYR